MSLDLKYKLNLFQSAMLSLFQKKWVLQIIVYFLHPDQRVKDARTKFQMGNFRAVLDGDIQGFLDATLRWRAGQPIEQDGE